MSSQLPAVVPKHKWLVGPGGDVTKYMPPPAPLDKHQRRAAFRKGLAYVGALLEKAGFDSDLDPVRGGQATTLSFTRKGYTFDISIKGRSQMGRIAYVTSHPGYRYQAKKVGEDMAGNPINEPTATVRYASDDLQSDQVIQIIGAKTSSMNPIYVELTDDIVEPEKHVVRQVMGVIAGIMADQKLLDQMNKDTSGELDKLVDPTWEAFMLGSGGD